MDFKGGIRWDKFVKTCGTLQSSDQIILNKLLSYGKHVRWVELIPEGLRMSYVCISLSLVLASALLCHVTFILMWIYDYRKLYMIVLLALFVRMLL